MRALRPALFAIALTLVAGCGGGSGDVPAPSPALGTMVDRPLPPEIATMSFTKPDGTETTLADYRGKPMLITDFMTECTDICPMITANTVALARALAANGYGKDEVALIEVSMDPRRDTMRRLQAYQKLFRPAPESWELLRASGPDTKRFWKYFHLGLKKVAAEDPPDRDWLTGKPLTYDIAHSDVLVFIDGEGHERFLVSASPDLEGRALPGKLTRVLGEQGEHLLHHPDPVTSWTVGQGLSVFSWLLDQKLSFPS